MRLAAPDNPRRARLLCILLVAFLLGAGVLLRIAFWAQPAAMHSDELALYVNLARYDAPRLVTGRLDASESTQAAPPLFLLAVDRLVPLGPPDVSDERRLRLLPALSSLLALPACLWLALETARRVRLPRWALIALPLAGMAVGTNMLIQSSRMKQYGPEMLAGALLPAVWLSRRREGLPRGSARLTIDHLLLGTIAAMLAGFAYPAGLLYLSLLAIDTWLAMRARLSWARVAALVPGAALGIGSSALVYLVTARRQRDPFLSGYWKESMLDLSRPWGWPLEVAQTFTEMLRFDLPPLGLGLLVFIAAGGWWLWRRDRLLLAALSAGTVITIAAATAGLYPFSASRLTLYLAPALLVWAGVGLGRFASLPAAPARVAGVALAALIVLGGTWESVHEYFWREPRLRALGAWLSKNVEAKDAIISPTLSLREHLSVYHPGLPEPLVWYRSHPVPPEVGQLAETTSAPRIWLAVGGDTAQERQALAEEALAALPTEVAQTARRVEVRGGLILEMRPGEMSREPLP